MRAYRPDVEMPPGECCQEDVVRALASDPLSASCNETAAQLDRIARQDGLDFVFETHGIDALLVSMEVGYMGMYVGAAGYPAVRRSQTKRLHHPVPLDSKAPRFHWAVNALGDRAI
jgi:hypothetical protein